MTIEYYEFKHIISLWHYSLIWPLITFWWPYGMTLTSNHQIFILCCCFSRQHFVIILSHILEKSRIPVATLPDSSSPLALRDIFSYGPYEWCRWSSHYKNIRMVWSGSKFQNLLDSYWTSYLSNFMTLGLLL